MKETLFFSNPEKSKEDSEEKKQKDSSFYEKRAYEKDPLNLPFFHSTHFANFLKIMENGGICSGYNLMTKGLKPGEDFEARTGGMRGALEKFGNSKGGGDAFYNGVFFSVGGIPEEGGGVYYSKECPITFLLDREGLKHYAFGTNYDGAGDLIVNNKNLKSPTNIKLADFSALFIPEDVYFDADGKIINPPYERFSKEHAAKNFDEVFKRFTKRLEAYESVVKKIKDANLTTEVNDEIKNIYFKTLKNLYRELEDAKQYDCEERNYSNEYEQKIEMFERYKDQIEWNGISGLLTLGDDAYRIFKYSDIHNFETKENTVKEFSLLLFDNFPYFGSGLSECDKNTKRDYYEQNKEIVDKLVKYINNNLDLKGSDALNPLDFETFKGRLFYSLNSGLYDFVKMQKSWEKYEELGKSSGCQNFKELMSNFISKKEAIVEKTDNEWLIQNYEGKNLPKKIVFFKGELADAVNEYVLGEYKLELPQRELPYDEKPSYQNKTRIEAAKAIHKRIKRLERGGLARCIGKVFTPFYNADVYSFKRSRFGNARLKSRGHKNK